MHISRPTESLGLGIVIVLVSFIGPSPVSVTECSVTLGPGQSIQAAIDQARHGDAICLSAGLWQENLVIKKSITLKGVRQGETRLEGVIPEKIVLQIGSPELIASSQPFPVSVENMVISGGEGCASYPLRCASGISISGRVAATLHNVTINGNEGAGVAVCCSAQASVIESDIHHNNWYGVGVSTPQYLQLFPVEVTIEGSHIYENSLNQFTNYAEAEVWLGGLAQSKISNSSISADLTGIIITDTATAEIVDSNILGQNRVINVWANGEVDIRNSIIVGGQQGLSITNAASASVSGSTFTENQIGIAIWEAAMANLLDNDISKNQYGVTIWSLEQPISVHGNRLQENTGCGILSFSNNLTGNHNRMVNNGVDLCGDVSGKLRTPLRQPEASEIHFPNGRYDSLQEAVDALEPGGHLYLDQDSVQTGGVTLAKPITLRAEFEEDGADRQLPLVHGRTNQAPVFSLIQEANMTVHDLRVSGGWAGFWILGSDAKLSLFGSDILDSASDGISVSLSAQAEVYGSVLRRHACRALVALGSAQVELHDSQVERNMEDPNGGCAEDIAYGAVALGNNAQATISGNQLRKNRKYGISVADDAQAIIRDNLIEDNADWGATLIQAPCVDTERSFTGQISGHSNIIRKNGESSSQSGSNANPISRNVCPEQLDFLMGEETGTYP